MGPRRSAFARSQHWAKRSWIAGVVNDAVVGEFDPLTGSYFTPVTFLPLIELADYADIADATQAAPFDSYGSSTKQDRVVVNSIDMDITVNVLPVNSGGPVIPQTIWFVAWYIFKGSFQDVANAVSLGGLGLLRYDPVAVDPEFLYRLPLVRFGSRFGHCGNFDGNGQGNVISHFQVKRRFRSRVTLKTDEELYFVFSASISGGLEEDPPPAVSLSGHHRCGVTD